MNNQAPTLADLLDQLLRWCEDAVEMVEGLDREAFGRDKKAQYATSKCIEGIGETARRILQDHPDFATCFPELPLAEAYRMRNRLAHGYERVNLDVVWDTSRRGAWDLAEQLRGVLSELQRHDP